MGMYGIILIFILVVMGGAIAFIGDRLGTKVGKKRLSMFGLRPRHTSIVVTILTGFLITALTLGAATLLSENVRIALFGMEQLNQEIHDTQQSLASVNEELAFLQKEREQNEQDLAKAQAELGKARQDAAQAKAEMEEVESALSASRRQIEELSDVRDALEAEREQLDGQIVALNEKQSLLESDVAKYTELSKQLSEGLHFIREGDIVYRAGELVASSVKAPAGDRGENEQYVNALLAGANQQVLFRLGIEQPVEAIWISDKEVRSAIDYLTNVQQDMIVRIVSAGNIVAGEPVRVHTEIYPNKLVYQNRQLVYEEDARLDGSAEQVLMNCLKRVNNIAVMQGILPDPIKGTVGVMTGEQFYETVHELETHASEAKIAVYADGDVYTAGPLRLRIKVMEKE